MKNIQQLHRNGGASLSTTARGGGLPQSNYQLIPRAKPSLNSTSPTLYALLANSCEHF